MKSSELYSILKDTNVNKLIEDFNFLENFLRRGFQKFITPNADAAKKDSVSVLGNYFNTGCFLRSDKIGNSGEFYVIPIGREAHKEIQEEWKKFIKTIDDAELDFSHILHNIFYKDVELDSAHVNEIISALKRSYKTLTKNVDGCYDNLEKLLDKIYYPPGYNPYYLFGFGRDIVDKRIKGIKVEISNILEILDKQKKVISKGEKFYKKIEKDKQKEQVNVQEPLQVTPLSNNTQTNVQQDINSQQKDTLGQKQANKVKLIKLSQVVDDEDYEVYEIKDINGKLIDRGWGHSYSEALQNFISDKYTRKAYEININNCSNLNVSGAEFDRCIFNEISDSVFTDCAFHINDFNNVVFQNVNFINCRFINQNMKSCNIINCNFNDGMVVGSTLNTCNFPGTTFRKIKFRTVEFENCDITDTTFNNCDLSSAEKLIFSKGLDKSRGIPNSYLEMYNFLYDNFIDPSYDASDEFDSPGYCYMNIQYVMGNQWRDYLNKFGLSSLPDDSIAKRHKLNNILHSAIKPILILKRYDSRVYYKEAKQYVMKYANSNNIDNVNYILNTWELIPDKYKVLDPAALTYKLNVERLNSKYPGYKDKDLALEALKSDVPPQYYKRLEDAFLASSDKPLPAFANIKPIEGKNFVARFLPRNDPRGLFLGNHTNCCQHVGGAAHNSALHGQFSPYGAFFVVESKKDNKIRTMSWVWVTKDNKHVVFDNAEGTPKYGEMAEVKLLYRQAAQEIRQATNAEVVLGTRFTKMDIMSELEGYESKLEYPRKSTDFDKSFNKKLHDYGNYYDEDFEDDEDFIMIDEDLDDPSDTIYSDAKTLVKLSKKYCKFYKFKDMVKLSNNKVIYILRGLPGSGREDLAKELAGRDGYIFSADQYFIDDNGFYEFKENKLDRAHAWCQHNTRSAMSEGKSPIVIDNTNVSSWELKPYVLMAQEYGYTPIIKEVNTPWAFDLDELVKRDVVHKVPRRVIKKMLELWEPNLTVDDVLNAESLLERMFDF